LRINFAYQFCVSILRINFAYQFSIKDISKFDLWDLELAL